MKLNPNCSEAVYRIEKSVFRNITEEEKEILKDLIIIDEDAPDFNGEIEYNPYFEDVELDLKVYDSALTHGWMTINEVTKFCMSSFNFFYVNFSWSNHSWWNHINPTIFWIINH